jgi:hypothetical protein
MQGASGGYGAGISFQSVLQGSSTLAEMCRITADGESAWSTTASTQDANLRFYTATDGSVTEKMRLSAAGYLGIGTTGPTQKLHLVGSGDTMMLVNDGTYNSFFGTISGQTRVSNDNTIPIVFATNSAERARITSGGDFTIGATSTSYRLACTVAAGADRDMFICGVSGVTNGLQVNYINSGTALSVKFNSITTTASAANAFLDSADSNRIYRSTSSLRYKKDVEDLDNLFADSILNLRPVWYRSKADLDNKDWSWYGLIAEEVAEVEPRLVHWTYSEDAFDVETVDGVIKKTVKEGAERIPDGVQYERLSVLLLDIVKRQNARLEKLEAEVSALKGVH